LSAVDSTTEKNILYNLNHLLKNKTAIIITHRISSLIRFDQILVMDDGEIVEAGTHKELMKQEGFYFDLYTKQEKEDKRRVVKK